MSVHRFDPGKAAAAKADPVDDAPADRALLFRNVIFLHLRGWSVRAIAEDLELPVSTIHNMIQRWRRSAPARS